MKEAVREAVELLQDQLIARLMNACRMQAERSCKPANAGADDCHAIGGNALSGSNDIFIRNWLMTNCPQSQRAAYSRRSPARDFQSSDIAGGAWFEFDDEFLSEPLDWPNNAYDRVADARPQRAQLGEWAA